ncbi:MAG: excinuclease ABC subunit UvrA [Gammaproteobacteria bacterium]
MDTLSIRGARTHNLKNIDLDLPRDRLIVITGPSGSGKSSLAFDTLFAEGQRRYVESLSAYARQFLSLMQKPDIDHIEGLSPAIAIEQKATSHNPRSTVGTITEIYDYLRLLYARAGEPRCPEHGTLLDAQTVSQMVDQVLALPEGMRVMLLAPLAPDPERGSAEMLERLRQQGYVRVRIDGAVHDLDAVPAAQVYKNAAIEAVVDRLRVKPDLRQRLAESFETALRLSGATARVAALDDPDWPELLLCGHYACPHCGYALRELEPRVFSFNSPSGACPHCAGLGQVEVIDPARVLRYPELSLPAGAIPGWDRRNAHYFQLLNDLAAHYGFDLDQPFCTLPADVQRNILEGSGKELIAFTEVRDHGRPRTRRRPFEGVIPNLQRRYRTSTEQPLREALVRYVATRPCPECHGARLGPAGRHVFVGDRCLPALTELPIGQLCAFFAGLSLSGRRAAIAAKVLHEVRQRLGFLIDVGLDYLSLARTAETLSGGELQRIRLASQIGAGLVGVMYILDEPSIGLHQRDNHRLLATLARLRDLGNTVIVVEHDEETIRAADVVVDIGPGAGVHGGRVVVHGPPATVMADPDSLTGAYLSGRRTVPVPARRVPYDRRRVVRLRGARGNNLKGLDVDIPVGLLCCITGVSGSGKSTLVNDTLFPAALRQLARRGPEPEPHDAIEGLEQFDQVVEIDQAPIGRTPRSNPATYVGVLTPIRVLFAATQEARVRGYAPGRFSFNVKGGRCEACEGDGLIRVEMHFLPDVYVICEHCRGARYNRETLEVCYKGKSIAEVLDMTVEEARRFFDPVPPVADKLQRLVEVGLAYIKLGQNATTLSGGEAQRIKLARELSRRDTGATLYILDEPTTGLHFHDIEQLLEVLLRLRERGNTIIVIEHNLEVIKTADWVIDLGPEGGDRGGRIVAVGTPEQLAAAAHSYTGHYLAPLLANAGRSVRKRVAQRV